MRKRNCLSLNILFEIRLSPAIRSRHDSDRIVVRFIFTNAIGVYSFKVVSSNPAHARCAQHYGIQFVSDLRQVRGFFRVFRFPPLIKLTA